MADDFDPYHRWLGIPAEEQPPDHYRLLGLVRFEADPEVIRDGSERQMAHIRRYGLGKHAEWSQRILNELAFARACLLEPAKKAAYDERLRAVVAAAASPLAGPAPARAEPAGTAEVLEGRERRPVGPPPVRLPGGLPRHVERGVAKDQRRPEFKSKFHQPAWLMAGLGGCALIVVLVIWAAWSPGGPVKPPPKLQLEPVAAGPIEAGRELWFVVRTTDPGQWEGKVRYNLAPGAPAGADVDAATGRFTWKPAAPGEFNIAVQAISLTGDRQQGETTVSIQVTKPVVAQSGPTLWPLAPRRVEEGDSLRVPVLVKDPGTAGGKLRFSLGEKPPGARSTKKGSSSGSRRRLEHSPLTCW